MIPQSLENEYLSGKCVLFVGAGLSMRTICPNGTKVPGWNEFVKQLVEFACERDYFSDEEKYVLINMLNCNKSISVAQIVIDELKETEFQSFLSEIFHDLEPNDPIYPILCKLRFRAIVTTNFDTLIEDAFQRYASQKIKVWTQEDIRENLTQIEECFLLKLHGTYERQSTVVLGMRGYLECLYKKQIMKELMESLLLTNTFLFVGYSMTDPDINGLIEYINAISDGNSRYHYIAFEKDKVSALERKYLRKHKNLIVVEYENQTGSHEGLLSLLDELKKKNSQ